MEFFSPILEVLKCFGPPLYKYVEYHRKLDEYKENLRKVLDDLSSRKEDIELSLSIECGRGKLPKKEVQNWLETTQGIISDAHDFEQFTIKKGKYFSRARQGKLVDKKTQQVKECYQKGSLLTSLVIDPPPARGTILPIMELAGQTTTMNEIWGYLMDNEVKKVGVYGMGGVGKTTLMSHINNRLLEETSNKFDNVIWVTVSHTVDLIQLQKKIATALEKNLPQPEDNIVWAGKLLQMLRNKRFVLILDDVWETIQLEKLGIPEPVGEDGCKLVITTRSLDVCRSMGCKPVKVEPLSEKEALELFLYKVELEISKLPTLKENVELVAKECAGLPLAIVTVASSMKREEDTREWRNAFIELSNNIKSINLMENEVFGRLKFSYDRLKDEKIQHCFLYCALYPEDYNIPKNELVDCWIAEGFVDEMDNLQATIDRAHIIIKRLVNNCLLEESIDHLSYVKMHDVVRDMVLAHITSKSSPIFMVKAGLKLEKLPNEEEWKENAEKVSLMKNSIREISFDMSSNCGKLSTLLLQENPLERISETFFTHMQGLKILNLSQTKIKNLPNSISHLTNLKALLLEGCYPLKNVPSLAKLSTLKTLNLRGTSIEKVPEGLEMLTNLRDLNLYSLKLKEFPTGILPKLCYLQKFSIYWGPKTSQATIEEAARLRKLDTFEARFVNLKEFKCYTKYLKGHPIPNKYHITVAKWNYTFRPYSRQLEFNKCIILMDYNVCEREDSILLLKDVQCLSLNGCKDVTNINDVPSFNTLERLEVLQLVDLHNLTVSLEVSKLPLDPYSNLKILEITYCHKLKNLFSSKLLPQLKNLEEIAVEECNGMEEMITLDDDDDEEEKEEKEKYSKKELSLPKLRSMSLIFNTKLKSICGSNGVMACESLQEIVIHGCPQLKRLPFQLPVDENGQPSPPPALKKIEVEREWWEALEWDHLHSNAKTVLIPHCDFKPSPQRYHMHAAKFDDSN